MNPRRKPILLLGRSVDPHGTPWTLTDKWSNKWSKLSGAPSGEQRLFLRTSTR